MEKNDDNIFQRQAQVVAKTKTKVGKPPTRLQKKAPATLEVANYAKTYHLMLSKEASSPLTPIPLLSPLILSPPLSPQQAEEFMFPMISGGDKGKEEKRGAYCVPGGWQHPAAPNGGYMEPSSLFTFFQYKCVLVNHAE
ncbi:uncharacterized protein LOC110610411 [Manihot esculenta]|uniref:Uncharacterized protein n=1 Tax=Manihot esculenta TaxID=3983 RepID=A0A2C9WLZ6_MANES|nr:uncharacterized protein LOC110610411 [Manihot esculenta]OAY61178.1 hypothetical protein MANES_01G169500v8 [Manihot esculenta]